MSNPTKPKPTVKELAKKVNDIYLAPENDAPIVDEEVWAAANAFFEENGLNSAQLKSYNDFIYSKAHQTIDQLRRTVIEEDGKRYIFEFGELIFRAPSFTEKDDSTHKLYPIEALQRNITYGSEMYIDATVTSPSGEPSHYDKIYLGIMPVMVKSDLCNVSGILNDPEKLALHKEDFYDHGGYFVISPKGENTPGATAQRRVLVPQERAATNRVFIHAKRKISPKYGIYAEVRSCTASSSHTTTTTVGVLSTKSGGDRISAVLPWIDATEIPLGTLFKALGVMQYEDVAFLVLGPDYAEDREALDILVPTLEYSYEVTSQNTALHWIGRRGRKFTKVDASVAEDDGADMDDIAGGIDDADLDAINALEAMLNAKTEAAVASESKHRIDAINYATHLLNVEFLPHVPVGTPLAPNEKNPLIEKAKYLGYMTQKLLMVVLGRRKPDLRDHMMLKRIATAGTLLSQQFYGAVRRLLMEISNNTKKALRNGNTVNILSWIKPSTITNAMQGAISGNNWSSGGPASKGIAQLYEQFNYASGIANMRKLTMPMIAEGGKVIEPRDLHGSHFGCVCPAETPEGKKAGLVKNLALSAYVTVGSDPAPVKILVENLLGPKSEDNYPENLGWARVFLNGAPLGTTKTPDVLSRQLRGYRRSAKIFCETSIAYFEAHREVHISTEAGRLCRPLFVVENGEMPFRMADVENLVAGEMTWTQLLASGTVELVDKAEEEAVIIVTYPSDLAKMVADVEKASGEERSKLESNKKRITHCEIHPSLIYGIGGSIIPFSNHNQCIYQEELVEMADGSKKKIKDVVVGDQVINFDPKTGILGTANVVSVISTVTNKQMWEIEVECGQKIITTYDHRFMIAGEGCGRWCSVQHIDVGDCVGITRKSFIEANPVILTKFRSQLEDMYFVRVVRKTPVDHKLISDITTDSPNQSFVCGGGFGVHNSPRNCYQCIWKEEPVLMANGSWKKIKNIRVGDEVVSFDPETMEMSITTVINHFVRPTEKKMVKITVLTQRSIVVTVDHKIMTNLGWMEAGDIANSEDTEIAILTCSVFGMETVDYVPVLKVEEVPNVEIADITTESENHSFIAGQGFCVHNSSMGKQAVGVPFSNYRHIMSGSFHTMMYLQKPLALTRGASIVRFDEMPAGQNAIIAILPRPFNEEDSIEMNQDSIDRGFQVSYKWTCFYAEVREERSEIFGIPTEENSEKFRGNAEHLTAEGFPRIGSKLKDGDIVIGKLVENANDDTSLLSKKKKYTNASMIYDHMWPAMVDKIQVGTTGDGYNYIRVMVVQKRVPVVGDKFSFMHGQKGTVGMKHKAVDFPFNSQGISPDIIINALAFPSRMTIAMLLEEITGKAVISTSILHQVSPTGKVISRKHTPEIAALPDEKKTAACRPEVEMDIKNGDERAEKSTGKVTLKSGQNPEFREMFGSTKGDLIDATPFRKFDLEVIRAEVKKYGYDCGDERLTDGITGKSLRTLVFFGPAYNQRLKHMVIDKMHARARGGMTTLMRQPVKMCQRRSGG